MHVFVMFVYPNGPHSIVSFVQLSQISPQGTNASVRLFCLLALNPSTILVICYGCVAITITLQTLTLRKTAATIAAAYPNLELYHLL